MKLKTLNPATAPNVRASSQEPSVTFYLKTGVFSINKGGIELLGLSMGDQIMLHQDEENQEDWYIEKVTDGGFTLRGKTKEVAPLCFNNSSVVREIMSSVDFEVEGLKGCKVIIAPQPTMLDDRELWCIIMTSAEPRVA